MTKPRHASRKIWLCLLLFLAIGSKQTIVAILFGGNLTHSWPTDHTGWRLQMQTNSPNGGPGTNWVDVINSIFTNQLIVPLDAADGSAFFRLKYH